MGIQERIHHQNKYKKSYLFKNFGKMLCSEVVVVGEEVRVIRIFWRFKFILNLKGGVS